MVKYSIWPNYGQSMTAIILIFIFVILYKYMQTYRPVYPTHVHTGSSRISGFYGIVVTMHPVC